MKKILSAILNYIFNFTKINNNKLLFESGRNSVDENPKALYDYIKKNCSNEFITIWLVSKGTDISGLDKRDFCFYKTIKGYYHQATSKYWIKSQSTTSILKKRIGQIYIQLWHGSGALKKGGYQVTGKTKKVPVNHAKDWDYFLATDEYQQKSVIEATGYNKKTKIVGLAKSDRFYNIDKQKIIDIKKKLGIQINNKKIVLYTPTFREKYIEKNVCEMKINKIGELDNVVFIVTCHPLMREAMLNYKLNNNIINAIKYPDVNDLLLIADVLIIDYSATIFEFSFFKKPMIFYPYDYDEYVKARNGFLINYKKDLPGPIVYNEEDLYETLKNIDEIEKKYKKRLIEFSRKYNKYNDGDVCKRIVDMIKNNELN